MPSAAEKCREPWGKCQGISHCPECGHPAINTYLLREKDLLDWSLQEQPDKASDSKRLDDDEDRQNPAYVPRKGAFFEHDLRRGSEDETGKTDTKLYVSLSSCDVSPMFGFVIHTLLLCV